MYNFLCPMNLTSSTVGCSVFDSMLQPQPPEVCVLGSFFLFCFFFWGGGAEGERKRAGGGEGGQFTALQHPALFVRLPRAAGNPYFQSIPLPSKLGALETQPVPLFVSSNDQQRDNRSAGTTKLSPIPYRRFSVTAEASQHCVAISLPYHCCLDAHLLPKTAVRRILPRNEAESRT